MSLSLLLVAVGQQEKTPPKKSLAEPHCIISGAGKLLS
ncbi:hypothetical protein FTV88_0883 [Heliorestis convoluta]|uniref:Uncharacterized protein n=1 Tax=Heliorestis convoluta TaxID=356322 RepID=A0A5Q2MZW4_9FIRM|nr:hypothetical protein FTV88_0883 [Heliorestis convoluta]